MGLRFCVSRKGGTGGGGWVHPKGANSMAASGLYKQLVWHQEGHFYLFWHKWS